MQNVPLKKFLIREIVGHFRLHDLLLLYALFFVHYIRVNRDATNNILTILQGDVVDFRVKQEAAEPGAHATKCA
jgi:hypothetical protein